MFSFREIEELREQKLVLDLQVEELQTRVHSLSSSLKQKDQEVEVSLLQGRIPSSRSVSLLRVGEPQGGSVRLNIYVLKILSFSNN